MEEDKEEKLKCERFNDKIFSCGGKLEDHRRFHSKQNSDQSEEKLRSPVDLERDEQNSFDLRVDPKNSSDISPSHGRVLGGKHVCKVCFKEFQSVKAVHGHMRLHSDKKKVDEAESKEWDAEGFYSLRAKKTTKTFNSPHEPGSSSCQNPAFSCKSNGETSSPMTIEPSSNLRSNEASQSFLFDFLAYDLEYESDERIVAFNLFMMARGMTEIDQHMDFPCNGDEFKVKLQSNISESTDGYGQKQAYEVRENRSRPSNWVSDEEETLHKFHKHKPNDESERPISSMESGINLNLTDADLHAGSSEEEEFQRNSKKPRRNSYKCRICCENFRSYQALGGHSIIHKDAKKRRMK